MAKLEGEVSIPHDNNTIRTALFRAKDNPNVSISGYNEQGVLLAGGIPYYLNNFPGGRRYLQDLAGDLINAKRVVLRAFEPQPVANNPGNSVKK